MWWVLVILTWSFDGSAYDSYPAYWFNTKMGCEELKAHLATLTTLPSTAELYCEEGKYYGRP